MKLWRIAIIGGGPGGLMTAYQLQKRANGPFATTIFEASSRIGGKILTNHFACAPVAYEAGAAELYDYSRVGEDPLRELIAELGLSTRPIGGSSIFVNDQLVTDIHDTRDRLSESAWTALQQFDHCARDWMTPKEFYKSDWKDGDQDPMLTESFQALLGRTLNADARHYVETLVHSDLATEPQLTNAAYGLQNYLMNDPAYMRLYTIDGGIERLPQELHKRIDARVLLNQPVVRVERADQTSLRVISLHGDEALTQEFDFVVVALPYNLLPAIAWGGETLAAAMRQHHAHYDHPGHYLRVSVLFERPFWRDCVNESYFMLDAFGGCCLYDESSRNWGEAHGVLGWLLGGAAAEELSHRTDDDLI
ncbi:MAG TPA: FAD-dependent oxidoreductase [Gemmataceae bacterium]|nr:FAD-dependent oxidoreductase [Gemmataceae bacterium]